MRLGRRAWGCDLNPEVIDWRPKQHEYAHNPNLPDQKYDQEYPFYEFKQAGLTDDQFDSIVKHMLKNAKAEDIAKAPGIGEKGAKKFLEALRNQAREGGPSITDYGSETSS